MKVQKQTLIKLIFLVFILFGCAKVTETSRIIMGTSVRALNDARAKGRNQVFDYDYETCYKRVILILKEMKVQIYLQSLKDKRIVAMNFEGVNKTTEVGFFFEEVTPKITKVEISCLNTWALESVSEKIFSALKGKDLKIGEGVK